MNQLYEHINFISGGVLKTDKKQQVAKEEYNLEHLEIVMPVYSPSWEYVIIHTPAIFNWLRKNHIAEDRVNRYLKGEKPFSGVEKQVVLKLKELSTTWDIVQVCFTPKFYVNKTYGQSCQHLTKRVLNSLDYIYNYPKRQIFLEKSYCQNCKSDVKIDCSVKRYPFVLMLNRYEDKIILDKTQYKLYLVIIDKEKNEAFIKIANGAWYQVGQNGSKIKTQTQIKGVKGNIFFYHRVIPNSTKIGALKTAQPFNKVIPKQFVPEPIMQIQQPQIIAQTKSSATETAYKPKIFITQLRPMKQQTYTPETYSHNSAYQQKIKQLYPKQKQKDQYDKQYDTGKVKKIKTKKVIHKIDFNRTEKQVRRGNIKPIFRKNKFKKANADRQL